jgi:hypothetical protein
MNCAGIHRSFHPHVSEVRSLQMDTWGEHHLKFMALGSNEKMKRFFEGFELMDESVQTRYKTVAADFYRK